MKKILIIDDDPDQRELLTVIFSGKYDIKEAGSRKEGFQVLEKFIPDLVILDVMMENSNAGFEMARELKNNAKFEKIKILMLTNVDNETNIDFKSTAGDEDWLPVDEYVIKPIQPKQFIERVENLID